MRLDRVQDTLSDVGRRVNDALPDSLREMPARSKALGALAVVLLVVALVLIARGLAPTPPIRFEPTAEEKAEFAAIQNDLESLSAMPLADLEREVAARERTATEAERAGDAEGATRAHDALQRAREAHFTRKYETEQGIAPR